MREAAGMCKHQEPTRVFNELFAKLQTLQSMLIIYIIDGDAIHSRRLPIEM
jgi:hypothetical protein